MIQQFITTTYNNFNRLANFVSFLAVTLLGALQRTGLHPTRSTQPPSIDAHARQVAVRVPTHCNTGSKSASCVGRFAALPRVTLSCCTGMRSPTASNVEISTRSQILQKSDEELNGAYWYRHNNGKTMCPARVDHFRLPYDHAGQWVRLPLSVL